MAYVKPQVLVFQEFTIVPTEITEPLRAHISGPHAQLRRYSNSDEKDLCRLGVYNPDTDTNYAWPHRTAGGRVDLAYAKVFVENALLQYYEQLIGDTKTITRSVSGKTNWIESVAGAGQNATAIYYKSNGVGYPRSPAFADRDVKIGDVVYLRAVSDDENCTPTTFWTKVIGFASQPGTSAIANASRDVNNAAYGANTALVSGFEKTGGVNNGVNIQTVTATNYNGTVDGTISEVYTVEVIENPTPGCVQTTALRVRSASKLDDVAVIYHPANFGDDVVIGTRGLTIKFTDEDEGAGYVEDGPSGVFVVGQRWRVTVTQAFTGVYAISNNQNSAAAGTYVGDVDDTYIIECTKGGDIDGTPNFPEITVRTVRGLDYAGPLQITASGNTANKFFAIGNKGVKVAFATSTGTAVTRMRKGDKWYINVTTAATGAVNRLILQNDLPVQLADGTPLDIKLFIQSDIQLSQNRLDAPPNTNYDLSPLAVTLKANATAFHKEWTNGGVPQPLPVKSGVVYAEYREWLSVLTNTVESISSVGELDAIAGPLDPDNPLKWGVYKALLNSNGTAVRYTAVANPADLDSWGEVLERLVGRDDVYNLVPLTFNPDVHNLYIAYVNGESNEIKNNWKGCFVSLRSRTSKKVVGQGAPVGGVLGAEQQSLVLATLSASVTGGTSYTLLQSSTGQFITNDVQPGDIVRYSYAVDGFGNEAYAEYVVDSVVSENALLLYSGPTGPVTVAQRVEIWHNMNRTEIADDVAERAGALSNRRVVAVWPDQVGSNGTVQPGFFLAAALAGLASGVLPHQGLTNVEVAGFDDYTRSYKLFNETQLDRLAEAGVWIVTEDRSGTPYTRHALTTDNLDLNRREEMIRRNVDSISYLFLRRLRPFIGRTNATPAMVDYLNNRTSEIIDFLKNNGYTQELGSQLIDGSIRVLRIHPLLKDRIEIVLDLVVPAPLNNIELHLVV